jgi:putative ubiquitin-RnfH superfamily antitoxin RatB of RatAB toxin-antitoxin module
LNGLNWFMGMSSDEDAIELIDVEVVYATPARQLLIALKVPAGTTAYEAAVQSNIAAEFPEIKLSTIAMGIFSKPLDGKGRPTPKQYTLRARDRVELYRPLIIDPKQARLARAEKAKMKD